MSSVPAVRPSASILPPCGFLLAFYCPAVDNGLPWRLPSVPAVLLALYRRAVVIGLPLRLSSVCGFLLAFYCPAVDNGLPWRVSSVPAVRPSASILPPCGVLLAHYCRAVDNGPPWRVSFVPAGSAISLMWRLSFVCVFCWHSIAVRLILVRPGVFRSFLPFC